MSKLWNYVSYLLFVYVFVLEVNLTGLWIHNLEGKYDTHRLSVVLVVVVAAAATVKSV